MFFILSKVLLFLSQPLVWIIVLGTSAFFLRRNRWGKRLAIAAVITFLLFSNHVLITEVLKHWEGRNETLSTGRYDAIVILGGYSNWNSRHATAEFNEGSDRLIRSLQLYRSGKTSKIVLSGGSGLLLKPEERESFWVRDILIALGVSAGDILVEGNSKNTHENAEFTSELLKAHFGNNGKYLLVTSAFHMNRASRCFQKTGLDFDYLRVDFCADDADYDIGAFIIPTAGALSGWQFLFKELLGYAAYSINGYY